jgi:hypothetical protein
MARFWQEGSGHACVCKDALQLTKLLSGNYILEILIQLADREMCVGEIANALDLPHDCVTRALKILHGVSMVQVKTVKQFHIYRLGFAVRVDRDDRAAYVHASSADGGHVFLDIPLNRFNSVASTLVS